MCIRTRSRRAATMPDTVFKATDVAKRSLIPDTDALTSQKSAKLPKLHAKSESCARKPRCASRASQRRTEHSVIERRRREKINDQLICLQCIVPACREQAFACVQKRAKSTTSPLFVGDDDNVDRYISTHVVLEKLCIISHALDYVMELRAKLQVYERQGHDHAARRGTGSLDTIAQDSDVHAYDDKNQLNPGYKNETSPHHTSKLAQIDSFTPKPTAAFDHPLHLDHDRLGDGHLLRHANHHHHLLLHNCPTPHVHVHDHVTHGAQIENVLSALDQDPSPKSPQHHYHHFHHHHKPGCRAWQQPWIPWHVRASHIQTCRDAPKHAAAAQDSLASSQHRTFPNAWPLRYEHHSWDRGPSYLDTLCRPKRDPVQHASIHHHQST